VTFSFCFLKLVVGVDCPACGLTRSIFALLKGHLAESIAWHPMGVLVVLWLMNLWWWRRFEFSPFNRQLISHGVLIGFFVPWVAKFLIP